MSNTNSIVYLELNRHIMPGGIEAFDEDFADACERSGATVLRPKVGSWKVIFRVKRQIRFLA